MRRSGRNWPVSTCWAPRYRSRWAGTAVASVPAYSTLLLGADPIARHGNPEQQQRFLPGVIDGSRILSAGLHEPGRSDPTRPATTARPDGATWRLDGVKELVSFGQLAETLVVP